MPSSREPRPGHALIGVRQAASSLPGDRAPEPVRFGATKTFVGTHAPIIKADGEGPQRMVTLKSFALEPVSASNARFAAFVGATN